MDTKRLRQFCAIAETGSLTKAAELLHITHSGLSKSMKLLQDDLGCLKSKELLVAYPLPKTQKNACRAFLIKHKDQADTQTTKKLIRMMKRAIDS